MALTPYVAVKFSVSLHPITDQISVNQSGTDWTLMLYATLMT